MLSERDVIVLTFLNGRLFFCPFSHKLLFYQKEFPLYDKQLSKLCHWLQKEIDRNIKVIDVGANIGDTVRNIGNKRAYYLCIEGDHSFSKFVRPNLRGYDFDIEEVFLGDKKSSSTYCFESSNGTGHLSKTNSLDNGISLNTLDDLLETKYSNKVFDLIKIDTDGFDFKILRGAQNCLQKQHPLVFFEWDRQYCNDQGEAPLSIFSFLNENGYSECVLFDNYGNVFGKAKTGDVKKLEAYIVNTRIEGKPYYYDVLAIPDAWDVDVNQLYGLFEMN